MGNCFSSDSSDADDISLLHGEDNEEREEDRTVPPYFRTNQNEPEQQQTMYHLSPGQSIRADELTEEEQVRMAQRIGLIQHLPRNIWDESHISDKKVRECVICMVDFEQGEPIRYLPCMHYYHVDCIDDWLLRSFTCPTCLEPVDAALLSTYSQNFDILG